MAVLGTHIADTYLRLRRCMGLLALLFPPVPVLGGIAFFGGPVQTSMSAYYPTGIPAGARARYVAIQKACGAVMTVCMAAALVYAFLLPKPVRAGLCAPNMVFWLEALAVWSFSIDWIVKSLEYDCAVSWLPWRRPVRVHGPATSDASSLPETSHAENP